MHKANLDVQEEDGSMTLHYAVKEGFWSIAWLLVEKGADLNLQDMRGAAVMHYAVRNGDISWYGFLSGRESI